MTGSTVQEVKSIPIPTTWAGAHAGLRDDLRDPPLEHRDPIVGVLERPVGRQALARRREFESITALA